mmetsp:Transcript_24956/g.29475  ORF Transcript_24956/g.29475 Transcript_24956/m.29475 type:complete len:109 (+) Transcript_24956:17-343(+)
MMEEKIRLARSSQRRIDLKRPNHLIEILMEILLGKIYNVLMYAMQLQHNLAQKLWHLFWFFDGFGFGSAFVFFYPPPPPFDTPAPPQVCTNPGPAFVSQHFKLLIGDI